jgi:hypothetical protein
VKEALADEIVSTNFVRRCERCGRLPISRAPYFDDDAWREIGPNSPKVSLVAYGAWDRFDGFRLSWPLVRAPEADRAKCCNADAESIATIRKIVSIKDIGRLVSRIRSRPPASRASIPSSTINKPGTARSSRAGVCLSHEPSHRRRSPGWRRSSRSLADRKSSGASCRAALRPGVHRYSLD